jgi:hypothetical protein
LKSISRKLRELEENVLELPEDDDILLHIGDDDEIELHEHARRIRETMRAEAEDIINNTTLTLEQQNEMSKQLLSRLTEKERAILEQSNKFIDYRLMRLVYKHFACGYPKQQDDRVLMRVTWFFLEMEKMNFANHLEDSRWDHDRNEDAPDFDDNAWWEALEAEIKEVYPEGIFTEKSFKAYEAEIDRRWSLKVKEYYDAHPEEREALINGLNKKSEELKKSE